MQILKKLQLENNKTTIYFEEDDKVKAVTLEIKDKNKTDKDLEKDLAEMKVQETLSSSMDLSVALWKRIKEIPENDFQSAISKIKEILLDLS